MDEKIVLEKCKSCSIVLETRDEYIQCDSCRVKFHASKKCSPLSATELRAFELGKRMLIFFCEDCLHSFKQMPLLLRKVTQLEEEVKDLKGELEQLKSGSGSQHHEEVFGEVSDRLLRMDNFMVYNVPESSSDHLQQRISDDNAAVLSLLEKLELGVTENLVLKTVRVGVKRGSNPRPLKVVTSSKHVVTQVLRARRKLQGTPFRVDADLTKFQQRLHKEKYEELKQRRADGETNLMIQTVNGAPKIVKRRDQKN